MESSWRAAWAACWVAMSMASCAYFSAPPLGLLCLEPGSLRGGWGRGGMCRVAADCPPSCACQIGFCVSPSDASDETPRADSGSADSGSADSGSADSGSLEGPLSTPGGEPSPEAWVKAATASQELYVRHIAPSHDGHLLVLADFRGTFSCGASSLASPGEGRDILLWKITTKGRDLWCKQYGGTGDERAHALVLDKRGAPYILAATHSKTLTLAPKIQLKGRDVGEILLFKASASGEVVWAQFLAGEKPSTPGILEIDLAGDLYAGWNTNGPSRDRAPCSMVKLSRSGRVLWRKDPFAAACSLTSSAGLPMGGIAVAGAFHDWWPGLRSWKGREIGTVAQGTDLYLASIDSGGALRWGLAAGTHGDEADSPTRLKVAPDGSIYWAGHFSQRPLYFTGGQELWGPSQSNGFVAKVQASGQLLWVRRVAGAEASRVRMSGLYLDPKGPLSIGGDFQHSLLLSGRGLLSSGKRDLFLAQLDASGRWTQLRGIGGPGDDAAGPWGPDGKGTLYWSGALASPQLSFDGHRLGGLTPKQQQWLWKMAPWPPRDW